MSVEVLSMTYHQTVRLLRDRYVFYPVQREWWTAGGGVVVTREKVAMACKIPEPSLIGFEGVQMDGLDHACASAYLK